MLRNKAVWSFDKIELRVWGKVEKTGEGSQGFGRVPCQERRVESRAKRVEFEERVKAEAKYQVSQLGCRMEKSSG